MSLLLDDVNLFELEMLDKPYATIEREPMKLMDSQSVYL